MVPAAAAAAKSLQSCPTLCNPIDSSPPGSSVPGTLQARILEWVAISFSNAWKWKVKVKALSRVWLLVIPWTAAHQVPSSMGFSRQEYWSGLPWPSPKWSLLSQFNYICFKLNFLILLGLFLDSNLFLLCLYLLSSINRKSLVTLKYVLISGNISFLSFLLLNFLG